MTWKPATIEEAIAKIERLENKIDELREEIDDLEMSLAQQSEQFDEALAAIRANRIEDALWELERALPDEFIGFAETIIKWKSQQSK